MDYWKSIEHLQPPPLYRGRAEQNWKDTSTNVRKTKKTETKRRGTSTTASIQTGEQYHNKSILGHENALTNTPCRIFLLWTGQ